MFLRALVSAADKFVTEIEADREFRREVGRLKLAAIRDLSQVGSQAVAMLLAKYFPGVEEPRSRPRVNRADLDAAMEAMRAEAEATENSAQSATPAPDPTRRVLDGDRVTYEAQGREFVPPGGVLTVSFGTEVLVEGTGFPGLPETQVRSFGVLSDFQPEEVQISAGFEWVQGFVGWQCMLPQMSGGVPAEALAEGKPQPKYPLAHKGIVITLQVKNVSDKPLPFRGRVIGREVAPEEDSKSAKDPS